MVLENEDELEQLPDDEVEVDEDDDDDLEDGAVADSALGPDDETDETSLDELLSQRAAARRANNEDPDEDDIMALTSEPQNPTGEPLPTRVIPIKDQQEFVCSNCHLVKARVQLADEARMLCRDCA